MALGFVSLLSSSGGGGSDGGDWGGGGGWESIVPALIQIGSGVAQNAQNRANSRQAQAQATRAQSNGRSGPGLIPFPDSSQQPQVVTPGMFFLGIAGLALVIIVTRRR